MKETNCDVIRDLLPLYEDNVVSEETAQMVREHRRIAPNAGRSCGKCARPFLFPPTRTRRR